MKYATFIFPALILLLAFSCKDRVNSPLQVTLPNTANVFIQQHFATDEVVNVSAKKSPTPQGTFYEATLKSGTEIDFGKEGNWIEVKTEDANQLPTSFFPETIKTYLDLNFNGIGVKQIDKDATGYKLELKNDVDLLFDVNGSFLTQQI